MLLKRWEPFAGLRRYDSEIDRLWRHPIRALYTRPYYWGGSGQMSVDVYRDGENLVVRASLPGVKPEDVDVSFTDNALTINGESKLEREVKEEEYLYREHRSSSFKRSVALPDGLNTDKADASYDNGVLTVTIPTSEPSKRKSLKVNVK